MRRSSQIFEHQAGKRPFKPRAFSVRSQAGSGDHGYRKPDRRLFQLALDGMAIAAENTLYVGNDMCRDIYGA
jgi:hypothetical protein